MDYEIPSINHIINLTVLSAAVLNDTEENIKRQQDLEFISLAIKNARAKEVDVLTDQVSSHDVHHYVAIYTVVAVIISIVLFYVWRQLQTRRNAVQQDCQEPNLHYTTAARRPSQTIATVDNSHSNTRIVDRASSPRFGSQYRSM